jgi:hypothetical protein
MKLALKLNADTGHESAEEWYGSYGAYISTDHGDLTHDTVDYDWLDDDDSEIIERLQESDEDLSEDEAKSLVALARRIREAAESVVSNLEAAVEAYEADDIDAVIDALDAASSEERDHGDDPSARQLRKQLIEEVADEEAE